MMRNYFDEFLIICKKLNDKGITPCLLGSVGLSYVTQKDWEPSDLDIHVNGDPRGWEAPDHLRIYRWEEIMEAMTDLGYEMIDLHEHEFKKDNLHVEFGSIDSLAPFANVDLNQLRRVKDHGCEFFVPTKAQFLKIYQASSQDSYRNDQNNHKDFAKIDYLKNEWRFDENSIN